MADSDKKVVYYLAYGSNLSAETFLGRRGIRPLSSINVVVPSLKLQFDLPGIPYAEPCFANSGARPGHDDELPPHLRTQESGWSEKTPLMAEDGGRDTQEYHKDRWHKGLVGVVYGLTPKDFAHVLATEGAGASYQDIIIACHPLDPLDQTVPDEPQTTPLQAHTLFAPPPNQTPGEGGGRFRRPDPSYAQASARYMKLITDGASEHKLPQEYRDFLAQIRPYTITTTGQKLGSMIFLGIWGPIVMTILKIMGKFTDDKGRAPPWAIRLSQGVFSACWTSYDTVFKRVFGDGERTIGQGEDLRRASPAGAAVSPVAVKVEMAKVRAAESG